MNKFNLLVLMIIINSTVVLAFGHFCFGLCDAPGDINWDSELNNMDWILLTDYLVQNDPTLPGFGIAEFECVDVHYDNVVNYEDVLVMINLINYCGDSLCDEGFESYQNCPEDCF